MIPLEMHAMTDVGKKRQHNEDYVGVSLTHGVAVLADGMGGYNAGEVASRMAVEIITTTVQKKILQMPTAQINEHTGFTEESVLVRDAILQANNSIFSTASTQQECAGMGTTVLAAAFYGDRITAAHVGDSRMYRLRDNILTHVTEDHSLIHEQVRRGLLTAANARNSSIKNLVTRALGVEANVEADIVEDMVFEGDLYLMCSDGLTDVVSDEVIHATLTHYWDNLPAANQRLIGLANEAGGPDNISVILIKAPKEEKSTKGFFSRLFRK
ncbi:PPM family protein phosphatase [Mariprofundus micogutta]|uniref:PPM family protein phosphatase n=1 Tax=Mariprofundus micogutta TaxID=1921010 RepID=A0A1L8CLJ3_9PROT|nr:Stp1/IreP family PP2C-type Ser/Thr phosphatase [Mariprofundus micogutta]GAV19774.1 PPM family protein phosphatase [Mariprofundus micogutta]